MEAQTMHHTHQHHEVISTFNGSITSYLVIHQQYTHRVRLQLCSHLAAHIDALLKDEPAWNRQHIMYTTVSLSKRYALCIKAVHMLPIQGMSKPAWSLTAIQEHR